LDIGILSGDLMMVSRILPVLKALGHRVAAGPDRRPLDVAIVDVGPTALPDWGKRIRALRSEGTRIIAFGPHQNPMVLARAKGLGADVVTINAAILRSPGAVLEALADRLRSEDNPDDTPESPHE